ncbi:MAG: ABC transporter permease [Clostridia bacterium]|nr:ABC transporter permease [Clostridia bacterium]
MKKHEAREPLFHIVKRAQIPLYQGILIRVAAIVLALLTCAAVFFFLTQKSPVDFYRSMFNGAFGTERRIWNMAHQMAILLCISLAVTPAFKMRFWNIGAEGQVLVGGLACAAIMFYFRQSVPLPLLWVMMTLASILASMVWAIIPAIFKANWNTNETLFTLMMNYIATQLVAYFINVWVKSGSGVLNPMPDAGLPKLGNAWTLNISVVAVLTVILYIYLRFSKHGYEIAVVGESENTARYIGVNVKKVILRTMMLSGAICGVAGLLIVGGTSYTINANSAGGQGFTAIMVSWLAKFNPLLMILTSFLIAFLQRGTNQVSNDFKMDNSISNIVTAIILFFIIGCEFFINYKLVFRKPSKEDAT